MGRADVVGICLLVFVVHVAITVAFEGCRITYGRRGCYHRVLKGVLVTCDGRGHETLVPQNIPLDTIYLSLVNFKFDTLKRSNFRLVKCILLLLEWNIGMSSGISSRSPVAVPWLGVCLWGLHECVCALCIIVLFVFCVRKTKHAITFVILCYITHKNWLNWSKYRVSRPRSYILMWG